MPDRNDYEFVLRELDIQCQRIQLYARGVRMADRNGDTELARALLDVIQSEFESGEGMAGHALHHDPDHP